ncbi:MAG: glycosyltransferase family 39 protein [Thermoguttaceae bacterium]
MRPEVRYQLWIAAAAGIVFFTQLGGASLWDMDEALYATCSREMLQRGDWVEPRFNGAMFPEKPPLMFWTMMAGFKLFGVNELGARFFSAVFGMATALAAFHLGRVLCNAKVGLWTGLITATTVLMAISARAATVDAALTLVTTLAFWWFVLGRKRGGSSFPLRDAVPMYACLGIAVLGKGPVGLVLPLAAMGLYLLVTDGWRNLLRSALWMRPLTAFLVVAAVALPWYVWVGVQTHGQWPRQFFLEFNLRPFQQPILGHGDVGGYLHQTLALLVSFSYHFYHLPALLVGFFPWSILLGPTLIDTWQRVRQKLRDSDGCVLALCWFATWLVFWSVCKTKLPHYLLPAYPALALLTARLVERWQTEPASLGRSWLRNAWLSLILVGVGIAIVVPIVARTYLPGDAILGILGLIPVVGGVWCWRQTSQGRPRSAAIGLTVTAVVLLTAMFGWGATRVDRHQNGPAMIAAIQAHSGDVSRASIATYRFFRESTVYYAGHPVVRCMNEPDRPAVDQLRQFLKTPGPAYVITTSRHAVDVQKQFPGRLEEIFRQRRFLGPDEMVVLARR